LDMRDWNEETEVRDLGEMDIGIMPVPDEPWARGKSGYKLIQYMACGIPVIASPVGANRDIVEPGLNGFLASSDAEWLSYLTELTSDASLRARFGEVGRQRAIDRYSLAAHGPRLTSLMKRLGSSPD
jgi:glycosyltransferase involved in cell wall biosynthesis